MCTLRILTAGYLPLAHILALVAEIGCLAAGTRIGYGTTKTITDKSPGINQETTKGDGPTLAPTVMAAVPAIMDKIKDGVHKNVDDMGGMKKKIFDKGYKKKQVMSVLEWVVLSVVQQ